MQSVSSRRYLSLWLRRLATDRLMRLSPSRDRRKPLALTHSVKNARRLAALDDTAARAGLRVGMSFADACAIHPGFDWAEVEPEADARFLRALAGWCEYYTPLVGLDPPDGLLFDITGVTHLFGGESAFAADIAKRMASFGLQTRIGIADSVGAAWAMARYGKTAIIHPGHINEAIAPLPLAALRIQEPVRDGLFQLGLKSIGDILARPRAPLAVRFGQGLLQRLDQILGREEEPIAPLMPVPALSIEQSFSEPLLRDEDILSVLATLTGKLCAILEKRGLGARQIQAKFFGVGGTANTLQLGASRPLREARALNRLFTEKFALTTWDNEFGYDRVRLSVTHAEAAAPTQKDLASGEEGMEFAHLIDRLSARLGERRVLRLMVQDTHVPELASAAIPATSAKEFRPSPAQETAHDQDTLVIARPVRVFERPEPMEAIAEIPDGPPVRFRWRRIAHEVVSAEGPERIAMPWWRDDQTRALTRDYFRVQTAQGARFWLYREGLYGDTTTPRWFMHGYLP